MKLGFSLKARPRRGAAVNELTRGQERGSIAQVFNSEETKEEAPQVVFVDTFDAKALANKTLQEQKALVIPLISANEWRQQEPHPQEDEDTTEPATQPSERKDTEATKEKQQPEEEVIDDALAAKRVLESIESAKDQHSTTNGSTLVIPVEQLLDAKQKKREELFRAQPNAETTSAKPADDTATTKATSNKKPILQQNAVPGLDELKDVNEKYRHDMSLRPDELDVHSDAYKAVPVEEFGAALLRGMGWKGSTEQDEDKNGMDVKPRQKLLGLGASAKPPDMITKDKHKHKHNGKRAYKPPLPSDNDDQPRPRRDQEQRQEPQRRNGLNVSSSSRRNERSLSPADRRPRREDRSSSRGSRHESKRSRDGDRDQDRPQERHRDRDRSREREHDRGRDRDRDRRQDRDRDRDRGRDRDRDRPRERARERHSDRNSSRRSPSDSRRSSRRSRSRDGERSSRR